MRLRTQSQKKEKTSALVQLLRVVLALVLSVLIINIGINISISRFAVNMYVKYGLQEPVISGEISDNLKRMEVHEEDVLEILKSKEVQELVSDIYYEHYQAVFLRTDKFQCNISTCEDIIGSLWKEICKKNRYEYTKEETENIVRYIVDISGLSQATQIETPENYRMVAYLKNIGGTSLVENADENVDLSRAFYEKLSTLASMQLGLFLLIICLSIVLLISIVLNIENKGIKLCLRTVKYTIYFFMVISAGVVLFTIGNSTDKIMFRINLIWLILAFVLIILCEHIINRKKLPQSKTIPKKKSRISTWWNKFVNRFLNKLKLKKRKA